MKVVLVNRFFCPDISATSQLLSDLAFHIAGQFEVHVITGRQSYQASGETLGGYEVVRNVHVHRVWTTRFGREWLPGRAVDYATFYLSAFLRMVSLLRRNDVIVALTDPPMVSVPAAVAARLRGAHLVNWLQDVFPETAVALGVRGLAGPLGRVLGRLRDGSLRTAAVNVALSNGMAVTLCGLGVPEDRLQVIHNWADGANLRPLDRNRNPLRSDWGVGPRFVVGYSGNMGRAHELDVVLRAAARLREQKEIVFLFVGEGHQKAGLLAAVHRSGLENVMFQPYQPRELLALSLTAPDCHLVSLKSSLEGLVFPSKLYSSLAAGRPVIFLGAPDAEICRMMRQERRFGLCVGEHDDSALADAILSLHGNPQDCTSMGRNGRCLFEAEFDQPIALAKWGELLSKL